MKPVGASIPAEWVSCRISCEMCWSDVAYSFVDAHWPDGDACLLRLCDRCLSAFELELEDSDGWEIGPLGTDGMPLQLCCN